MLPINIDFCLMQNTSIKAIIVTIGDELLIGQVVDTNSAWIGQELSKAGIKVIRKVALADDKDEIKKTLATSISDAEIIIITGGLGPTKDDITKHTLTEFFGSSLITNQDVLNDVTNFFNRFKRPMLEANIKQADVPSNCTVLRNKLGTAPGMLFEKENKLIVSLPGVPFEMKGLMTDNVLPIITSHFRTPVIIHRTIMTVGIGESFLAEKINDWENNLPEHIKLAYLPNLMMVRLRLSGEGKDEKILRNEIDLLIHSLTPLISEYIFAYDDISLEQQIGIQLKEYNKTVSTAESCTGGYISHKITSIQGSSNWYKGSIIAYDYETKMRELAVPDYILSMHGAVSEEVVAIMAHECRKKFNSDFAISASGIAGPDGGTPEKPVGTVWIAVASDQEVKTKKLQLHRNRVQNIEMTAIAAMDLLRKMIV
jgi:nicotinamide-nucleotide amidase